MKETQLKQKRGVARLGGVAMTEAQLDWERGVARLGCVAQLWERRSSNRKEVQLNWEASLEYE